MSQAETQKPTKVFKILTKEQWADWESCGTFRGASIDLKDGYIHLSTSEQAVGTYEKFFKDQQGLVLAVVDLERVTDEIKWEPSRKGQLFPHVYGSIDRIAVLKVVTDWQGQEPVV